MTRYAFSSRALAHLAGTLRLDLPYPLTLPAPAATAAERTVLRGEVEEELHDAQLLDHAGSPPPQLEHWLHVLARPEASIDSVHVPSPRAGQVRAVVALAGRTAVLAVQRDPSAVRLRAVHRDHLAATIVDLLPEAVRGTERSISLPVEPDVEPDAEPADEIMVGNRYAARNDADQRSAEYRQALARLDALPRTRGGQVAANSRCPLRGRRRSPVLAWFDNAAGRYFAQYRDRWLTVVPADRETLRRQVRDLVTEVSATTPARGQRRPL